MAATERITMTMRELDRFKVIQDVADGKLQPWRAAERLGTGHDSGTTFVAQLDRPGLLRRQPTVNCSPQR
ncbi:hypothetical protein [Burkholderia sp. BCC0419]|uniref:hypothetical protein n=1 Tax=Burkholderia sp. BCC0419 TaxID=486878 RepID=UPI00158A24EE|nr:hypothetical protein [Burkholderia sp. BCC0419]